MTCENCKKLEIRIAELEEELRARDDEFAAAEERMTRANQRTREAESQARRHKQDAEDAESFRDITTGEIRRAMERGDDTAVSRGLEKLKRGW